MLWGLKLFEIPIYRLSPDDFDKELERIESEFKDEITFCTSHELANLAPEKITEFETQADYWLSINPISRSYLYNDIIGYIQLLCDGTRIRAEYWWINKKRILRDPKNKLFRYRDKLFEFYILSNSTNESISKQILKSFENIKKDNRFKKRYFDLETVENLVYFIDWLGFYKSQFQNDPLFL
ncbi:hypothetical protein ADN00_18745 [Ornatilinea apprima]|uniref:Uncharacterized protein n=1 Tax=Ornatilinea apprima TaxID=1134406 RepID=A0A0P6XMD4_9CHLR|nr:hypothetical protein [Ornatilinea apprima]KPL70083.1 hypothetical protein ADN00_18745 [Ornatilinea apprima]